MTLTSLVVEGFRATNRYWKMVAMLYVVNLIAATLLAVGIKAALDTGFGASLLPDRLLGGFDATVYNEFMRQHGEMFSPLKTQLTWVIAAYILLNVFLGGGVIASLQEGGGRFSMSAFFQSCGAYVTRLTRLFLMVVAGASFVGIAWFAIIAMMFGLLTSSSGSEVTTILAFAGSAVVFLIPFFLLFMMTDYAKVLIVTEERKHVFRSLWDATKFCFRSFWKVVAWQAITVALVMVILGLSWLAEFKFTFATTLGVLGMFLLHQTLVFGRIWARVYGIRGQIDLSRAGRVPEWKPLATVPSGRVAQRAPAAPSIGVRAVARRVRRPAKRVSPVKVKTTRRKKTR